MLSKPLFLDENTDKEAGTLNVATEVKILEIKDNRIKIEIDGWRKRMGAGRVIYDDFGLNILLAKLTKETARTDGVIEIFSEKEDPLTGLMWQEVKIILWTDNPYFLSELKPIWGYTQGTFKTSCSICHVQPEESHFDANTWPGIFKGMLAFVRFDSDTQALVEKYLQKHSSTFIIM